MVDDSSGSNELFQAIGSIAAADAEADEWQLQALYALLLPQPPEVTLVLTSKDSADVRAHKIKVLLERIGLGDLLLEGAEEPASKMVRRVAGLKSRRDSALHSVYSLSPDGSVVARYRSRSGHENVSISELKSLNDDYRSQISFLKQLTSHLENLYVSATSAEARSRYLLEQARFAGASGQAKGHMISSDSAGSGSFAMDEFGRVITESSDSLAAEEFIVTVDSSVGKVEVKSGAGEHYIGGDTGWRDVTELAKAEDETVEKALIRRVDSQVHYVQRGGSGFGAQARPDSLLWRVSTNPYDQLPRWIDQIEGFRFRPPSGQFGPASL